MQTTMHVLVEADALLPEGCSRRADTVHACMCIKAFKGRHTGIISDRRVRASLQQKPSALNPS